MDPGRFDGKVVLLTGAGSGIGRATAHRLSEEGATVFAIDIDETRVAETADQAKGTVVTHRADVADPDECRAAVEACVAECGRLDVLGNIAGIVRGEHVTDVTVEQYRRMMAVNVDGYFFMAQAAIPHLLETSGNIVNVASNAGLMSQPYSAAYCASKGGVVQLTRALADEYLERGVRVNCVAPGGIDTPLQDAFRNVPEGLDWKKLMKVRTPLGTASPDEVAALIAFIASAEGRYMTGAVVSIDGGLTM